jgi:hypothetical protein
MVQSCHVMPAQAVQTYSGRLSHTSVAAVLLPLQAPEADYMDAAMITVMQIHLSEPEGDILLFLTGRCTSCKAVRPAQTSTHWIETKCGTNSLWQLACPGCCLYPRSLVGRIAWIPPTTT